MRDATYAAAVVAEHRRTATVQGLWLVAGRSRVISDGSHDRTDSGKLFRNLPSGVRIYRVWVSSLVFIERNVGGRKLNILVT